MNKSNRMNHMLIKGRTYERLFIPLSNKDLIKNALEIHRSPTIEGKIFLKALKTKLLFNTLMRTTMQKNVEPKLFHDFNWNEWQNHALNDIDLDCGLVSYALSQSDNRRFFALIIDRNGIPKGFAKIALDEQSKELFKNESQALNKFEKEKNECFIVPKLLSSGSFGSSFYLIQEVIPTKAKFLSNIKDQRWIRTIDEISRKSIDKTRLRDCSWWWDIDKSNNTPKPLIEYLARNEEQEIDICNVHGDFTPGNILSVNDECWVYDWEEFNPTAPALTDYLSFAIESIGKIKYLSLNRRARIIIRLMKKKTDLANTINLAATMVYMATRRSCTINDQLSLALHKIILEFRT